MKFLVPKILLSLVLLLSGMALSEGLIYGNWESETTNITISPGPTITAVMPNGKVKTKEGRWIEEGRSFQIPTKKGDAHIVTLNGDELLVNGPKVQEVFHRR